MQVSPDSPSAAASASNSDVENQIKSKTQAKSSIAVSNQRNRWIVIVFIALLVFIPFVLLSIFVPAFYNDDGVWYATLWLSLMIICVLSVASYFLAVDDESEDTKQTLFSSLKQLFARIKLFLPTITHFADTASDIGLLIEFYKSSEEQTRRNEKEIDYRFVFNVSLIVMLSYRIISCYLVYNFTKNIYDAILQFFDFYLFKVIRISVENNHYKPNLIQKWIRLLEALLESSPQALIALYILLRTYRSGFFTGVSPIVLIASVLSVLSIIERVLKEDSYFLRTDDFKSLDFDIHKVTRLQCINYKFLIRVLWRNCDILSHIILYVLAWILCGGWVLITFLAVSFIISLVLSNFYAKFESIGNNTGSNNNSNANTGQAAVTKGETIIDKDGNTVLNTHNFELNSNDDGKEDDSDNVYFRYFSNNFDFSVLSTIVFAVPINPFEFHSNLVNFVLVVAFRWIYQIVLFILIFHADIGRRGFKNANQTYATVLIICVVCWVIQVALYLYFSIFETHNATLQKNLKGYITNIDDWNILTHYGYKVELTELYQYSSFANFNDPLWIINEIILKNDKFKHIVNNKYLFINSWHGMLSNRVLSKQNEQYWNELCANGNLQLFINLKCERAHYKCNCQFSKCHSVMYTTPSEISLFWEAVRCQNNVDFIKFLTENYNIEIDKESYDRIKALKFSKIDHQIDQFIQSLLGKK